MTDNVKNDFAFVIIWAIIITILLGCYENRKKEKELKYMQEYLEQSEYSCYPYDEKIYKGETE